MMKSDPKSIKQGDDPIMYYGRTGFGIVFVVLHFLAAGAFLYFMYNISKSLKKIAKSLDKNTLPALPTNPTQQVTNPNQ